MDKGEPVDVSNVPAPAGPHESDRDNESTLLVVIDDKPATVKGIAVDEKPRSTGTRRLDNVRDEPFGEAPRCNAGRGRCGVLVIDRRGSELQPVDVEQLFKLGHETRLVDLDLSVGRPIVEA
jgi:hypothetical protein